MPREAQPWEFAPRIALQRDNQRRISVLAQRVAPLLAQGDEQAITRAKQVTAKARMANQPRRSPVLDRIGERVREQWATPVTEEDDGGGGFLGGLKDAAGAVADRVGDAFEFVDTPISERLGVRIPDLPGPLDEVGNKVIEEATRPTNYAIAFGGSGLAARAGATAARGGVRGAVARGVQFAAEPALKGSGGRRLAGEIGLGVGARTGAEIASGATESLPFPLRLGASLLGGFAGGAAGARAAGGIGRGTGLAPGTGIRGAETPEALPEVLPNRLGEVFGMRTHSPITTEDFIREEMVETFTGRPAIEARVTPLLKERTRVLQQGGAVDSYATEVGAVIDVELRRAFQFDETGTRIPALADVIPEVGAPTVADVAARLPEYAPHLDEVQLQALGRVRNVMEPFYEMLTEQGVELHRRGDITEGGFYIPRGKAELAGEEQMFTGGGRSRSGGKMSAERSARFESQAAGVESEFEYRSPGSAVYDYVREAGARAVNEQFKRDLKGLEDIYTPEMNEALKALRAQVTTIRAKVSTRMQTLLRRQGRLSAEKAQSGRDASRSIAADQKLDGRLERIEDMDAARQFTQVDDTADDMVAARFMEEDPSAALIRAEKELDMLELEARRAERDAGKSAGRTFQTRQQIEDTLAEIGQMREELTALKPAYEKAQRIAADTPRGMAKIQMTGLEQVSFPERVAAVVNNQLASEKTISGKGASVVRGVNTVNRLLRMLGATGDVSFMGIQGLLGAATSPKAYARATKVAYQAMKDPEMLGSYLREKDPERLSQMVRDGVRISGSNSEFTTIGAVSRISDVLENSDWFKGLNPIRGSNRSFGTFGDVMRIELYEALEQTAKASGLDITDDAVRAGIAASANHMTGAGSRAFLGDEWGGLVVFAPRYFQSQLTLLGKAFADGGVEGALARRTFTRLIGAAVGLTVAANAALGQNTDFDPSSPNFLRVRAGGQDVSLLGPWGSMMGQAVRLGSGEGIDRPADLFRSESPVLGATWDLITGEDFRGRDTQNMGYIATRFLPFSVQNALEEGPGVGSLLNPVGVNASPMSPYDRIDATARFMFGTPWHELEPAQQEELRLQHAGLWQEYSQSSDTRGRAEGVRAQLRTQQEASDSLLLSGELSRDDWREQRSARLSEQRARLLEIYGDEPVSAEAAAEDPMLHYVQVIQQATDPTTGAVDWDAVEVSTSQFTQEEQAFLDRNLGVRQTPLSRLYRNLSQEYYELPRYKGYTADEAREIDELWQAARNQARSSDEADMLRALRKVDEGYDESIIKGVRRRIVKVGGRSMLREDPARERYRRDHPEAALVTGAGPLTAKELAAIEAALQ